MILWREYRIFSLFIILIPTPDFPHFYYMLGRNLGSLLYGDVSVMSCGFDSTSFLVIAYFLVMGLDIKMLTIGPFYHYIKT